MSLPTFPSLRGIAFPAKRSPVWSTDPQDALSGRRIRVQRFSYPVYRYEVSFRVLRSSLGFTEWQTLEGFIKSVQGSTALWRYDDPDDDSVTAQGFGETDGITSSFQLVRGLGGFAEPVFLVNGAPQIFIGGVLKTAGIDYTISAYGVVNFAVAPSGPLPLTWTGKYFWPCRFDEDVTEFVEFMSGFRSVASLKFSTEKLP